METMMEDQIDKYAKEYCDSLIKFDHIHLDGWDRINRVLGFKAGFKHCDSARFLQTEEIREYLSDRFGSGLKSRVEKLSEEVNELSEVANSVIINKEDFVDELADITLVTTHIASLVGKTHDELVDIAMDKVKGRESNPNYKRKHPHKDSNRVTLKKVFLRALLFCIPAIPVALQHNSMVVILISGIVFNLLLDVIVNKRL